MRKLSMRACLLALLWGLCHAPVQAEENGHADNSQGKDVNVEETNSQGKDVSVGEALRKAGIQGPDWL